MDTVISTYNKTQTGVTAELCNLLQQEIQRGLPEAEGKVWHGGPVWFFGRQPDRWLFCS